MENPKVSVIVRTRNRANLLTRAVESILSQEFKDFEVVIVDDASEDNTPDVVTSLLKKDRRIRSIRLSARGGFSATLNQGIKKSAGKYIAILDDDDFWCDMKKLEKQVAFLDKNEEYVVVGAWEKRINKEGRVIARYMLPENDRAIRNSMLAYNPIAHSSSLFRKDVWEKVGGYDEKLYFSEDWDLWMRLGKFGKLHNIPEFLVMHLRDEYSKPAKILRRIAMLNLALRRRYRAEYPYFWKGYLIGFGAYIITFLPFQKVLHALFLKIRSRLFRISI